jgi:hypothetical protein
VSQVPPVDHDLQSEHVVRAHEEDGNLILSYHQDIEEHLKLAHYERSLDSRVQKKHEFRKTMTVPFNIIMQICNDTGLDFFNPGDAKAIVEILKRPEYAAFRTVADVNL